MSGTGHERQLVNELVNQKWMNKRTSERMKLFKCARAWESTGKKSMQASELQWHSTAIRPHWNTKYAASRFLQSPVFCSPSPSLPSSLPSSLHKQSLLSKALPRLATLAMKIKAEYLKCVETATMPSEPVPAVAEHDTENVQRPQEGNHSSNDKKRTLGVDVKEPLTVSHWNNNNNNHHHDDATKKRRHITYPRHVFWPD